MTSEVATQAHTPEPWKTYIGHDAQFATTPYILHQTEAGTPDVAIAQIIVSGGGFKSDTANARRIVACVNACAGLSTEALEAGALAVVVKAAGESIDNRGRFEPNAARRRLAHALQNLGALA